MSRQARLTSSTDIYHVILRGINHQQIFEDDEDRDFFLARLSRYKYEGDVSVFSYCLMSNHIHLLLRTSPLMSLSVFLKKLETSFVMWYNRKYERTGPLFSGRFKSEPVEDRNYLLTVLNYIHMNPVKAYICGSPDEYTYSSFGSYNGRPDNITDVGSFCDLIGVSDFSGIDPRGLSGRCMDIDDEARKNEVSAESKRIFKQITRTDSASAFQKIAISNRNAFILKLRAAGLSVNQINRYTGVSRALIYKILRRASGNEVRLQYA